MTDSEKAALKPEVALVQLIETHMEDLCTHWMKIVRNDTMTRTYGALDEATVRDRICRVYKYLAQWLKGEFTEADFASYYTNEGATRRREGFRLVEVIQAFAVTRRVLWLAVRDSGLLETTDMTVERAMLVANRVMLFFDQSMYYMAFGYERQ